MKDPRKDWRPIRCYEDEVIVAIGAFKDSAVIFLSGSMSDENFDKRLRQHDRAVLSVLRFFELHPAGLCFGERVPDYGGSRLAPRPRDVYQAGQE